MGAMVIKAPTSGHATRARASAGGGTAGSRPRARSWAGRPRVGDAAEPASTTRRGPRPFFWPTMAQHVTRAVRTFPFRDVSAAAAGAGALALWALALSLLAV